MEKLINIREKIDNANYIVRKLKAQVEEIGYVINTLQKIVEYTNLLVLNTNLKAERIGETGKNFLIFEKEQKKEFTKQFIGSKREIVEIISSVQRIINETLKSINRITSDVVQTNRRINTIISLAKKQSLVIKSQFYNENSRKEIKDLDKEIEELQELSDKFVQIALDLKNSVEDIKKIVQQLNELSKVLKYF